MVHDASHYHCGKEGSKDILRSHLHELLLRQATNHKTDTV